MVASNGETEMADEEAGDSLPGTKGCSSPPCMLHELDAAFMEHSERMSAPAGLPAASAAQDWEEVRLWRRAKRTVLIERRLAMPAEERAVHSEAITAALAQVLPSCRGTLIGFYWPFKGEYDRGPWLGPCVAKGCGWLCRWSLRGPSR